MTEAQDSGLVRILGHPIPRLVSSREVELAAVRNGAALLSAPWERRLDVTGPDAASFLHALLTQQIRDLGVGTSRPAALATRKGHLVADLTVFRASADGFHLRLPSLVASDVLEILQKHQIMEDIRFEWAHENPDALLLAGPEAGPVAARVAASLPGDSNSERIPSLLPVNELSGEDAVLFFESDERERILDLCLHAGAVSVGWDAFDRRRIELGRGWFGIDADSERLVPEPGFDDRIHYDKGCYLGQEPLARLHFRGRPNWALVRLQGEAEIPPLPGARLLDASGDRIGWLTSCAAEGESLAALGYLHRRFRETGVPEVRAEAGPLLRWLPLPA